MFYRNVGKRAVDIAVSLSALIILSPLLAATTVWLHFANKGAGASFPAPPRQKRQNIQYL